MKYQMTNLVVLPFKLLKSIKITKTKK